MRRNNTRFDIIFYTIRYVPSLYVSLSLIIFTAIVIETANDDIYIVVNANIADDIVPFLRAIYDETSDDEVYDNYYKNNIR